MTRPAFNTILFDQTEEHIAVLTFNRPEKLNLFTHESEKEFSEVLKLVSQHDKFRVLIITGTGRAFSAGEDINSFPNEPGAIRKTFQKIKRPELLFFEKPVIAAVNGIAAGMGADCALMSDIIIATEGGRFIFPGAKLGIICPYAFIRLADEIGRAKAKEILMTGEPLSVEEAADLGLVNKVVPAEHLMDEALHMARKIAKAAPLSVRAIKESVNRKLSGFEYSYETMIDLLASEDRLEGMKAFLEKREPRFLGK